MIAIEIKNARSGMRLLVSATMGLLTAAPLVAADYATGFEPPGFQVGSFGTGVDLQTQSDKWSLFVTSGTADPAQLVTVLSTVVKSGGQALAVHAEFAGSNQGGVSTYQKNTSSVVVFEMDFRLGASNTPTVWQLAVIDPANAGFVGGINIASDDGRFQLIAPGFPETAPVVARDVWYRLRMSFNMADQTYDVLMDGSAVSSGVPFLTKASHLGAFQADTFGGGDDVGYFDNFNFLDPAPEIQVSQPAKSTLVDGKSVRKFGTARVGGKGSSRIFTIRNVGTEALTGLSVAKGGVNRADFRVGNPLKKSLAPGEKTTFKVVFAPRVKGTRRAAIHIRSNDADENPFDIKVTGGGK